VLRAAAGAAAAGIETDFGTRWELAALAARAWSRLGQEDSAIALGRRAVAALERMRGDLVSGTLRASLLVTRADVYGNLVLALLSRDRVDEAFEVADGARSQGLLRRLGSARSELAGGVPGQLAEGERLLQRIDRLTSACVKARSLRRGTERRCRERGWRADRLPGVRRSEYETWIIRTRRPIHARQACWGATPTSARRIRSLLTPTQALVEYLVTPGSLVAFLMTADGSDVVVRPFDSAALTERASCWPTCGSALAGTGGWACRPRTPSTANWSRHSWLREAARVRELLVVPHGILGRVPFAASRIPGRDASWLKTTTSICCRPRRRWSAQRAVPAAGAAGPGSRPSRRSPTSCRGPSRKLKAIQRILPTRTVIGPGATESMIRDALATGQWVHAARMGSSTPEIRCSRASRWPAPRVPGPWTMAGWRSMRSSDSGSGAHWSSSRLRDGGSREWTTIRCWAPAS